jgi:hypothetical protein
MPFLALLHQKNTKITEKSSLCYYNKNQKNPANAEKPRKQIEENILRMRESR